MRLLLLCSVLLGVCSAVAHADTYDFYVHECFAGACGSPYGNDTNLEFTVTIPPAPDSYDADSFTYNNVNILQTGSSAGDGPSVKFSKYGFLLFGSHNDDDTFSIDESNNDFPVFDGNTSSPVIQTGTADVGTAHSNYTYGNAYSGTLTVTDLSAVPTPEPSSVVLLGTGLLGAVGLAWRRVA